MTGRAFARFVLAEDYLIPIAMEPLNVSVALHGYSLRLSCAVSGIPLLKSDESLG